MKRLIDRLMEPEEETTSPDAPNKEYIIDPEQVRISTGNGTWVWGYSTGGFVTGGVAVTSSGTNVIDSVVVGPMGTAKNDMTLDEALAKFGVEWPKINTDYDSSGD